MARLERYPGARQGKRISGRGSRSGELASGRCDPCNGEAVKKLSHYNAAGDVAMVDVSAKEPTKRTAAARAEVIMAPRVIKALPTNKKGDPLQVARIAGIHAAKKTSELIPLCHQIPLSHVSLEFKIGARGIDITATAATTA